MHICSAKFLSSLNICAVWSVFTEHSVGSQGSKALWKRAYSNILKISWTKNWKFSDKNSHTFHISAQNIACGYLLGQPHWGSSNEYPQSMFFSSFTIQEATASEIAHLRTSPKKHFCEIILKYCHWPRRRCRLKVFKGTILSILVEIQPDDVIWSKLRMTHNGRQTHGYHNSSTQACVLGWANKSEV